MVALIWSKIDLDAEIFDLIHTNHQLKIYLLWVKESISEKIEIKDTSLQYEYKTHISSPSGIHSITADLLKNSCQIYRGANSQIPIYYYKNENIALVSNSLNVFSKLPVNLTINYKWIACGLSGIAPEAHETYYESVKKLRPGSGLQLSNWEFCISDLKKDTDYQFDNLEHALSQTVLKYIGINNGCELSGGLDSSAIAGWLSHHVSGKQIVLNAFNQGLKPGIQKQFFPYVDERNFAKLVELFHKNLKINIVDSFENNLIDDIKLAGSILASPALNSLSYFNIQLFRDARRLNVSTLFSGFGGDEAISARTYQYPQFLISQHQWKELLQLSKKNPIYISKSIIKYFVKKPKSIPAWKFEKWDNTLITNELKNKTKFEPYFFNNSSKLAENFEQFLLNKINHPAVKLRVEENSSVARHFGIDYAYPLLDEQLIYYYLNIPDYKKFNINPDRHLFRQAISKVVPPEIKNRTDKTSATIPNVYYRLLNEKENIIEIIHQAKQTEMAQIINLEKMLLLLKRAELKNKGIHNGRLDLKNLFFALGLILFEKN
ncbi:MAG: asparagine synthase [Bacteroidales bacterium]|nr:asparagine synthase [Bacteroidales bacterium]